MPLRRLPLLLVLAVLPLASARADLAGFGTNGTGFTLTQGQSTNGLSVSNDVLTLTSGGTNQGNAIFSNTPQNVGAFRVAFTYQNVGANGATAGTANGFTFTLQNDSRGAASVGGSGSSLGYALGSALTGTGPTAQAAIAPSLAVGFNFFNGSSTGLGTTGALTLTNQSAAVLSSGHPINVALAYNGTTLTETLTDATVPANTSTFNYNINLLNLLNLSGPGGTAYVGFTGADGNVASAQTISNFSFTTVPEPSTWAAGGLATLAGAAVLRRRLAASK